MSYMIIHNMLNKAPKGGGKPPVGLIALFLIMITVVLLLVLTLGILQVNDKNTADTEKLTFQAYCQTIADYRDLLNGYDNQLRAFESQYGENHASWSPEIRTQYLQIQDVMNEVRNKQINAISSYNVQANYTENFQALALPTSVDGTIQENC